ncbi:unnamed protein product, partial [Discosporangium mesarthrocarpum]
LRGWALHRPSHVLEGGREHPIQTPVKVWGEKPRPGGWFPTSLLVFVLYWPFGLDDMELFSDRMSEGRSKGETSSVSPNEVNDLIRDAISNPSSMEKLGGRRKRPTGRAELRETGLDPFRRTSEKDSDSIGNLLCLR